MGPEPKDEPTLAQLKVFVTVARCESVTQAAQELSYANLSSVIYHIRSLERAYGVELFIRGKKRMQLTEAGRILYNVAVEVLRKLDDAGAEIAQRRRLIGKFAFGGPITTLALMRAVCSYLSTSLGIGQAFLEPKITVYWSSREAEAALSAGELEAAILPATNDYDEERLDILPFEEEEFVVICREANLHDELTITREELAQQVLLVPAENLEARAILEKLVTQAGLRFQSTKETLSLTEIREGVVLGRGIAILAASTAHDQFRDRSARFMRLEGTELYRKLVVARLKDKEPSRGFRTFLSALAHVLIGRHCFPSVSEAGDGVKSCRDEAEKALVKL